MMHNVQDQMREDEHININCILAAQVQPSINQRIHKEYIKTLSCIDNIILSMFPNPLSLFPLQKSKH